MIHRLLDALPPWLLAELYVAVRRAADSVALALPGLPVGMDVRASDEYWVAHDNGAPWNPTHCGMTVVARFDMRADAMAAGRLLRFGRRVFVVENAWSGGEVWVLDPRREVPFDSCAGWNMRREARVEPEANEEEGEP